MSAKISIPPPVALASTEKSAHASTSLMERAHSVAERAAGTTRTGGPPTRHGLRLSVTTLDPRASGRAMALDAVLVKEEAKHLGTASVVVQTNVSSAGATSKPIARGPAALDNAQRTESIRQAKTQCRYRFLGEWSCLYARALSKPEPSAGNGFWGSGLAFGRVSGRCCAVPDVLCLVHGNVELAVSQFSVAIHHH